MPGKKPPENDIGAPGLAGGPGPTPPGVDDGTPHPSLGATEGAPQSAEEQGEEARVAERTAGTRRDELLGRRDRRADPGEGTAGERDRSARREPDPGEQGAGRAGTRRRPRRGGRGTE